ncbi:hypothetical protein EVJ20_07095 [Exiguobacterium sp. SH0S1]|uniref:putative immunity protein n=1 Tax=Exiguobacterium sp. SH0S1 TaxID=2510949 RepID=UPI001040A464|nr:hypothetical protein [Exiguobacterium sp. SH0S1]TCI77721.1 hypothetical protein EVJ20_07095 [Exiguobacterium sp. SH0S1]
MKWTGEVETKLKQNNQILFTKRSDFLADLEALIRAQTRRTMVLWAFELAEETVDVLKQRYPNETRLETAVRLSKGWAAGNVKMPVAKQAILEAHAVAKELTSLEDIALCHAVGQACSVVHTKRHAIGVSLYELTALVRCYGLPACIRIVEQRKQQYMERIAYWRDRDPE